MQRVRLALCAALLAQGCLGEIEVISGYVGPLGLQGLEGEVEGEAVSAPAAANLLMHGFIGFEEYQYFEDYGWLVTTGEDTLMEAGTFPIDRAVLHMPTGNPLASDWLCSPGSELTRHDDETHEARLQDLSVLGSCVDSPPGPYTSTLIRHAFNGGEDTWVGSPELYLDGATLDGLDGTAFLAQTDHGRAWLWFLIDEELQPGTSTPLVEAAVLAPDASGTMVLSCAGPGSTITETRVPEGTTYEVDLTGVSIVGQCPGTPISGSLVARYYHGRYD